MKSVRHSRGQALQAAAAERAARLNVITHFRNIHRHRAVQPWP